MKNKDEGDEKKSKIIKNMFIGIMFIVIVIALVALFVPIVPDVTTIPIRLLPTTGGSGICPSLSQYYDPEKGYCLERPKMVLGAEYGGGECFFDKDCGECGVCDRFGECQC